MWTRGAETQYSLQLNGPNLQLNGPNLSIGFAKANLRLTAVLPLCN